MSTARGRKKIIVESNAAITHTPPNENMSANNACRISYLSGTLVSVCNEYVGAALHKNSCCRPDWAVSQVHGFRRGPFCGSLRELSSARRPSETQLVPSAVGNNLE